MKRILFFSLMALTMTTLSCKEEDMQQRKLDRKGVDVVIGVNTPDLEATRSNETNMDSALGAISNFSDDEWAQYDVRYILEVYDVSAGFENLNTPVTKRMVNTHDTYQATSFKLRLIPGRTYKFVVWADFVKEDTQSDLNYNTTSLKNITRTASAPKAMDESMDAYFAQEDIYLTGALQKDITLTRPFGKVRVVTTDINQLNIGSVPHTVNIHFYNHPIFQSLNALTGNAEVTYDEVSYPAYTISKDAPYTEGYDSLITSQTLFADYIFAQYEHAQEINFTMQVVEASGRVIHEQDFNTQIPLERNKLTTIIGNLLTTNAEFTILIDDNFAGYLPE